MKTVGKERERDWRDVATFVSLRSGGGEWSDAHSTGNVRVSGSGVIATATNMNVEVQYTAESSVPRDRCCVGLNRRCAGQPNVRSCEGLSDAMAGRQNYEHLRTQTTHLAKQRSRSVGI
jgi:hypothetical protein